MNADKRSFKHKELAGISVFYDVYNELGHGFIESVYERAFELALTSAGIQTATEDRDSGSL